LKVAGKVRLHLRDRQALEDAWLSLAIPDAAAGAAEPAATVQRMAPRGVDTVLQVHDDRSFGSLMSFGVGGLATELLNDRGYAVVPLAPLDAADLISAPKASPLLSGYGGGEPADLAALTEVVLRLSRLADDLPEVVECLLEPVVAAPGGAYVLDARVRIAPPLTRNDIGARRLRGA
jgi:acyl-CoA synthetase (NDP forming)